MVEASTKSYVRDLWKKFQKENVLLDRQDYYWKDPGNPTECFETNLTSFRRFDYSKGPTLRDCFRVSIQWGS